MGHAAALPRKLTDAYEQVVPAPARETVRTKEASQAVSQAEPAPVQAKTADERIAVLETRWEETIPKLATKADLAEVRSGLVKWTIGVGAAILVGILSLLFASHHSTNARIDSVSERIDSVSERIDSVNAKIDSAVAELRAENRETNARVDQVNQRLDQVNQRLDRLFELIASQQAAK